MTVASNHVHAFMVNKTGDIYWKKTSSLKNPRCFGARDKSGWRNTK